MVALLKNPTTDMCRTPVLIATNSIFDVRSVSFEGPITRQHQRRGKNNWYQVLNVTIVHIGADGKELRTELSLFGSDETSIETKYDI